jgi:hypothetical protein
MARYNLNMAARKKANFLGVTAAVLYCSWPLGYALNRL